MKRVNRLPEGRVEAVHLRVVEVSDNEASSPRAVVEYPIGKKVTIQFPPHSDIDSSSLKIGEWYEFRDLIHFGEQTNQTCPNCENELSITDPDIQQTLDLLGKIDIRDRLVTTKSSDVSGLDEPWLTFADEINIAPIECVCENCNWSTENTVQNQKSVNRDNESLRDRIAESLRETTDGDSETTLVSSGKSQESAPFQEQIYNNQVPDPSDIVFEDILSGYTLGNDILDPTPIHSIDPACETAVSRHPISADIEKYCNVRINSRKFDWARERPTLNLVIAIDVSGSMGLPVGNHQSENLERDAQSRIRAVSEYVSSFIQRLDETDTIGVVVFNEDAKVVRPLSAVTESTARSFESRVSDITPEGNTDLIAGFERAGDLFGPKSTATRPQAENRVLVISDTIPAQGGIDQHSFLQQCKILQEEGVGTSLVSIYPTALDDRRDLCRVPGSNLALATTENELRELLGPGVDSLLFPIAREFAIKSAISERVDPIGTSSDDSEKTDIIRRQAIFPDGPTAKSLEDVFFQLPPSELTEKVELEMSWKDRSGNEHHDTHEISVLEREGEFFQSENIRVKIALYRYYQALRMFSAAEKGKRAKENLDAKEIWYNESIDIVRNSAVQRVKEYLQSEAAVLDGVDFAEEIAILDLISDLE